MVQNIMCRSLEPNLPTSGLQIWKCVDCVGFHGASFKESYNNLLHTADYSCTEFFQNITKNVENRCEVSYTSFSIAWLSLRQFLRNTQLLDSITQIPSVPKFTNSAQEISEVRIEIHVIL